jgi:hypothetical protein
MEPTHPQRWTRRFDGAPPALPPILDRASERWWRTSPRIRVLAVLTGIGALLFAGTVRLASSPWGPPTEVLVAARDLAVGERVSASDVRRADWPVTLVPPGALTEVAGTVVAPVPAGGVVTDRHVGDGGLGAAVPTGHAAVAVPAELVPDLPTGAHLDLIGSDLEARGVPLAAAATVLADGGEHVWVVVTRAEAPAVATAAASGALTVVVLPP